ncbi:Z1 domain protein [Bacillus pseudomycoides]|uniref:Z1 domain-containing protein n=1 Tax=Bacillus pseudomycoides TaxID=64104 RepID=UPI0004ED8A5A|nr:Z1 domain-containing protein [Bacillus pseudomycoides]AIK39566.1 Z1 domain protein [Bacillus pseudomycoides]AJI17832.1 Z1 domain protein [Bacillus pseudomycoides]
MYNDARSTALRILNKVIFDDSTDVIAEVNKAIMKATIVFEIDESEKKHLKEDLLRSLNITMTLKSVLINHDDKEHIPWLNSKNSEITWRYWNRYKKYLQDEKKWPLKVINSLDDTSNSILELLEDPKVENRSYDRRGLVLGYVQSGKTANYTALINKAFDSGFKLIIVLAGMHNDLRSQTQMRLDEEVLGYETSKEKLKSVLYQDQGNRIGVGKQFGENFVEVFSLTTRDHQGDFNKSKSSISVQPKTQPLLLVVKKNVTVLKSVLKYFRNDSPLAQKKSSDALFKTVNNIPLLIIDDEADQASVNTVNVYEEDGVTLDPDYDPSKINGLIREIYNTFEQKSYIGYTATPFANIFINQNASTNKHQDDLFPKDFIISLPKPSNYVGPSEFFMLNSDVEDDELSLINTIKYEEFFAPVQHKKDFKPQRIPESLRESIYSFILAIVIRRKRGQVNVHNSMLVHVTRFKDVQKRVKDLIVEEVREIKQDIRQSKKKGPHYKGIKYFFETKYHQNELGKIRKKYPYHFDKDISFDFLWEEIEGEINSAVASIKIKEINGNSKDALEYNDYKETGLNVIAIGGNKLSRGLTLEGLVVSYYLRASKMYDTLMQMGRWFGYRQNYLDVCRIYTTKGLINWFHHIAVATEELRGQLEYMSEINATPSEFLLKVKNHPEMYVTSTLKMRSAKEIKVSYSNELIQTTVFPKKNIAFFKRNFIATKNLIEALKNNFSEKTDEIMRVKTMNHHHDYWENVDGKLIEDYLESYTTVSSASRANSKSMAKYINARISEEELLEWTVILINTGKKDYKFAGLDISKGVLRNGAKDKISQDVDKTTSIKTLTSMGHEFLDFSPELYDEVQDIISEREGRSKVAASKKARSYRDSKKGLLIIYPLDHKPLNDEGYDYEGMTKPFGIAISFPESKNKTSEVDYLINTSVEEDEEYWSELE